MGGRDASGDDAVFRGLIEGGIKLLEIVRGEARKGLQLGWFKTMVRMGKKMELDSLDSSVLSLLDQKAGDFWRSVQALTEADGEAKENDANLVDKATVRNRMLNLVQVYSVNQEEMQTLGFKDVNRIMTGARTRSVLTLAKLHDAMETHKKRLSKDYDELKGIVAAMHAGAEAEVRSLLTGLSMRGDEEAQTAMQEMVTGSHWLRRVCDKRYLKG